MGGIKEELDIIVNETIEETKKEFFEKKKTEDTQIITETIESVFTSGDEDKIASLDRDILGIADKYASVPKKKAEINYKQEIYNYALKNYADESFIAQNIVDGTGLSMAIVKANLRQLRKEEKLDKEDGTWTLKGVITHDNTVREILKQLNEEGYVTSSKIQQRLGAPENKVREIGYIVRSFVKEKELERERIGKEWFFYRPDKRPQFLTPAEEVLGYIGDEREMPLQKVVDTFGDRFNPKQILGMTGKKFYLDKTGEQPKLVRK